MAGPRVYYDHSRGEWVPLLAGRATSTDVLRLRQSIAKLEAIGGVIGELFGAASPEAAQHKMLWEMLSHDLTVMEQQDLDS